MSLQGEEDDNDEDGTFGTASSPSQLHVKCQDYSDDEDDDEQYEGQDSLFTQQNFSFKDRRPYYDQSPGRYQERYPYEDPYAH